MLVEFLLLLGIFLVTNISMAHYKTGNHLFFFLLNNNKIKGFEVYVRPKRY